MLHSEESASTILSLAISVLCILGGTFFSLDGMGPALALVSKISPVKWPQRRVLCDQLRRGSPALLAGISGSKCSLCADDCRVPRVLSNGGLSMSTFFAVLKANFLRLRPRIGFDSRLYRVYADLHCVFGLYHRLTGGEGAYRACLQRRPSTQANWNPRN